MTNDDWWRGSVTYQIYPRSFQDGSSDGVGDLKGITSRLGHIADLGVDAIWLSPIFTSPMADMGYDVSDYRDIDPVFGTISDFDEMIGQAHSLGLKVIVDQVISHSSDRHPVFAESRESRDNPRADWYVWADPQPDGAPPNNWQAIFGGPAWEWDTRRRQYYFHNFLREQPDFNFHNPDVQDWHLSNMRFWLERGVDGFRLDTVNFYFHDRLLRSDAPDFREKPEPAFKPYDMQYHLFSKNQPENLEFLTRIRDLTNEYDARTLIGEVGEAHHAIEMMGTYTSAGRLHMAYSFEMLDKKFSVQHFRSQLEDFFKEAPEGWPCWAFSNHDVIRHVSRWQEHGIDQDRLAKLSCAMLLTFKGSVCLYQGEELGQTDTELAFEELTDPQGIMFWPKDKGRDGCRTPMAWTGNGPNAGFSNANSTWLPIKPPQQARAVDTQQNDPVSVLSFYKQMLALRKERDALKIGNCTFLDLPEPILGFVRGNTVACIFNLSLEPHKVQVPFPLKVLVAEEAAEFGDLIELGPNGFLVGEIV